ncbi:chemotaxis protein CheW [Fulvivirga sp.]|uniref:chemotaxis protein CheW n=1 Tax=Fulvivirga sp. TaxID=1931237 RepID=UPI0032ED33BF
MSDKDELNIKEAKEKGQAQGNQQLIVFRQGNEEYGIQIDQIKEVVLTPNITKMPQTPNYVKGVANIRGNIIGIIDLEEKFGIKDATTTDDANKASNYTLVVESDEFKVGILVTEVPNTLTVTMDSIEQSVNIVHDNNVDSDYIQGIVKLDSRLIILIDIFKILEEKDLETMSQDTAG